MINEIIKAAQNPQARKDNPEPNKEEWAKLKKQKLKNNETNNKQPANNSEKRTAQSSSNQAKRRRRIRNRS